MMPWKRITAAIDGDDLCVSVVGGAAGRVWTRRGPRIAGFLALTDAERRDALTDAARGVGAKGRGTLVAPGAWCVSRPIEMTTAEWSRAREEVERSIDRLLPLTTDDAMVGLVDVFEPVGERAVGGAVIGVRRSHVEPWIAAVERAIPGCEVDQVLSPEMAALGAGLADRGYVVVLDDDGVARATLSHGRIVAVGDDAPGGSQAARMTVAGHELAEGAALAAAASDGAFAPLLGKQPTARRRWAPAVAAAVVAVAAFGASHWMSEARYERASERLAQRFEALSDRVHDVHASRAEAERWTRLLNEGVGPIEGEWGSVLPRLAAAQGAVSGGGIVHRVEIDSRGVTLRGEAATAGEALRALEESNEYAGAEFTAPVSKGTGALEVFEVRAKRETNAGGRP